MRRFALSPRIVLAGLAVVLLAGCARNLSWEKVLGQVRGDFPQVEQLSTDELAGWLGDGERQPPLLIDVRELDEYRVSHLPGAVHVAPDASAEELPAKVDRTRPIVAYCSVGYRSSRLVERLREAGFEEIYNLEGSIFRWANEGRPVVRGFMEVEGVHPFDRRWGRLLDERLHDYGDSSSEPAPVVVPETVPQPAGG